MNTFMEFPDLVIERLNNEELVVLRGGDKPPVTPPPNNGFDQWRFFGTR